MEGPEATSFYNRTDMLSSVLQAYQQTQEFEHGLAPAYMQMQIQYILTCTIIATMNMQPQTVHNTASELPGTEHYNITVHKQSTH